MQVVVLAGGLGTRLRPITEATPKPMVEVSGRPFLQYIVEHLVNQDLRQILLLVGYLGEHVEQHFGNGERFGAQISYSAERSPLGTGGAIRNALDQLDTEFIVLFGDSFLPIDYQDFSARFRAIKSKGLLAAYNNAEDTDVLNNLSLDAQHRVTRYEKGIVDPQLTHVEAGAICFQRDVFESFQEGSGFSMEHEIYPRLIGCSELYAYETSQRFYDIGTIERLNHFAGLHQ